MDESRNQYLRAMRADGIPIGDRGLWRVLKAVIRKPVPPRPDEGSRWMEPGTHTYLRRYTGAHLFDGGETVMNDSVSELVTHLNFAMRAWGDVLVTGLGLGCVLRGLQLNPRVRRVWVVERSVPVIDLVWPWMSHDRLVLIRSEAGAYLRRTRRTFDCAWHDIWTDPDRDEGHLALAHQRLWALGERCVSQQEAWAFPRWMRRMMNDTKALAS